MKCRRWLAVFLALTLIVISILIKEFTPFSIDVKGSTLSHSLPIVVVDAGHGGIDSGTSGEDGTEEKQINLAIAVELEHILHSLGFQVVMTRRTDDLISDPALPTIRQRKQQDIYKRLSIAQEDSNRVLISIHQNHYSNPIYSGTQIFYSDNHPDSVSLAQKIQNQVATLLQPENNRQVKKVGSEIYLLDQCANPAVMVECGFMSNVKELSLLKNEEYQRTMALMIAVSLLEYYRIT